MNEKAKALFLEEIKKRIPENPKERVNVMRGKLKQGSSFSIDGLICEAYLKANKLKWDGYQDNACLGQTHVMPRKVADWAGLERTDPYITTPAGSSTTTLSQFNDNTMPNITQELYNFLNQQL